MSDHLVPPANDREALASLWSRMWTQEEAVITMTQRQDRFDAALAALRTDIQTVQDRVSAEIRTGLHDVREDVSSRLDRLDTHLEAQDATQATLREVVAGAKADWPRSAVIAVTAVVTLTAATLAVWLGRIHP